MVIEFPFKEIKHFYKNNFFIQKSEASSFAFKNKFLNYQTGWGPTQPNFI
jgi:hypothetical protein